LLRPELAHFPELTSLDDGLPESAALTALVEFAHSQGPLTTVAIIEHFVGTPHEAILAAILATAEDHALAPDQVEAQLTAAIERWHAQDEARTAAALLSARFEDLTPEQRETVRRRFGRET
jgi:predicted RNA polymerase sigma factor